MIKDTTFMDSWFTNSLQEKGCGKKLWLFFKEWKSSFWRNLLGDEKKFLQKVKYVCYMYFLSFG